MILTGAIAAVLVCVAGLALGDRSLRWGCAIILACWAGGLACQLLRIRIGPDGLVAADAACAAGLAILLCAAEFRGWILAALMAQLLMLMLRLTSIEVNGRHLHSFVVAYDTLNALLLAAVAAGLVARLHQRRAARGDPR